MVNEEDQAGPTRDGDPPSIRTR